MKKIEIQGDVALRAVESVDYSIGQKVDNKVLAWGEISGHAHVITGDAEVFQIKGKMIVCVGHDGAKLEHLIYKTGRKGDHAALSLSPNTQYEVILQNEYNPFAGALQRVVD